MGIEPRIIQTPVSTLIRVRGCGNAYCGDDRRIGTSHRADLPDSAANSIRSNATEVPIRHASRFRGLAHRLDALLDETDRSRFGNGSRPVRGKIDHVGDSTDPWRRERSGATAATFVRYRFAEAYQFDWSHEVV